MMEVRSSVSGWILEINNVNQTWGKFPDGIYMLVET